MYELLITPQLEKAFWRAKLHGPPPQPSNIYFTEEWPDIQKWLKGKYFQITQTVIVPYDKGYIIPGDDVINLNLSNVPEGLKLYPTSEGVVYECLIGFKPGNYQVGLYIPGVNDYLLALAHTEMYPDLAHVQRKYLGFFTPDDSPYTNPMLKLWFVMNMPSWILKIYVLPGINFEKVIIGFRIAKHRVKEIPKPDIFTTIPYYTEYRGTW